MKENQFSSRGVIWITVLALVLANGSIAFRFKPMSSASPAALAGAKLLPGPARLPYAAPPAAGVPEEGAAPALLSAEEAFGRRQGTVGFGDLSALGAEKAGAAAERLGAAWRDAAPKIAAAWETNAPKAAALALSARRRLSEAFGARSEPRTEAKTAALPIVPGAQPKPSGAQLRMWAQSGYLGGRRGAVEKDAGGGRARSAAGQTWYSKTAWSYRSDGTNSDLDRRMLAALERQNGRMDRAAERMDGSLERMEQSIGELVKEPGEAGGIENAPQGASRGL